MTPEQEIVQLYLDSTTDERNFMEKHFSTPNMEYFSALIRMAKDILAIREEAK